MSDCVYGPYEYIGNTGCNIDHGSYFTYRNQTYFASGGMDNPNKYFRSSFLAPCHYRKNGMIVVDQKIMGYGCGQYDASWKKIMASWYFESDRECKIEREDGSFVTELFDGSILVFPNIRNVQRNTIIHLRALCDNETAVLIIHEGKQQGRILGRCEIVSGQDENMVQDAACYQEISCALDNPEGSLSLCLEVKGKGPVYLESFFFETDRNQSVSEPALSMAGRGAVMDVCEASDRGKVLKNLNLKNTFIEAVSDGGTGGDAELQIWYVAKEGKTYLTLIINENEYDKICFPDTKGRLRSVSLPVQLKAGVNRIRLESREYQNTFFAIDHLIMSREKETACTYSAAEGQMIPRGNGCWEGMPQRECDPQAYAGRAVKYLDTDGHGFELEEIDGGEGGKACLIFHYSRGTDGSACFYLRVNGKDQEIKVEFMSTGSCELRYGKELEVYVTLQPGDTNRIELIKAGGIGGITIDALTVIPEKATC